MLKKYISALSIFLTICCITITGKAEEFSGVICSPTNCYKIVDKLGEGSFGKVYSAIDSSGMLYAIKCFKYLPNLENGSYNSYYSDPKREFEIGQELDHPNIIKSYDYFEGVYKGESVNYLVVEHVNGAPLSYFPKKYLSEKESIRVLEGLLDALIYALSKNCLYLDLHDNNLMLNKSLKIKMIDLASFFTLDEIHQYFIEESSQEKSKSLKNNIFIKNMKLKNFFSEHSLLHRKLLDVYQGHAFSVREDNKANVDEEIMFTIFSFYLENITDVCVDILFITDLTRNKRMNLRTKIKQVSWNYSEDIEEGNNQPISYYIQQLSTLAQKNLNLSKKRK